MAHVDEVDEASIELLVGVQIPEGVKPVAVVQVGVAAHHLPVDGPDVVLEVPRETCTLAAPFVTGELRKRSIDTSRASRNGAVRAGSVQTSRGVGSGRSAGRLRRDRGVGREKVLVANLSHDPLLDQLDVLIGRDFDRLLVVVQPSVGVTVPHQP